MAKISAVLASKPVNKLLSIMNRIKRNFSPGLKRVRPILAWSILGNFAREGDGWAPLKPKTVKRRVQKGFSPGPILNMNKSLIKSITEEGARSHIEVITKNKLEIGSRRPYAAVHQLGATIAQPIRPKRKTPFGRKRKATGTRTIIIPARPFLYLNLKSQKNVGEEMADWVQQEIQTGMLA